MISSAYSLCPERTVYFTPFFWRDRARGRQPHLCRPGRRRVNADVYRGRTSVGRSFGIPCLLSYWYGRVLLRPYIGRSMMG